MTNAPPLQTQRFPENEWDACLPCTRSLGWLSYGEGLRSNAILAGLDRVGAGANFCPKARADKAKGIALGCLAIRITENGGRRERSLEKSERKDRAALIEEVCIMRCVAFYALASEGERITATIGEIYLFL